MQMAVEPEVATADEVTVALEEVAPVETQAKPPGALDRLASGRQRRGATVALEDSAPVGTQAKPPGMVDKVASRGQRGGATHGGVAPVVQKVRFVCALLTAESSTVEERSNAVLNEIMTNKLETWIRRERRWSKS